MTTKNQKITKAAMNSAYRHFTNHRKLVALMDADPMYGFNDSIEDFSLVWATQHPARYGSAHERRFGYDTGMERLASTEESGDWRDSLGFCYETKATMITAEDKQRANFVQLRPFHAGISHYALFVINMTDIYDVHHHSFLITADEMDSEIKLCKAGSAHGSKVTVGKKGELRFTISTEVGTEAWDRWVDTYEYSYSTLCESIMDGTLLIAA